VTELYLFSKALTSNVIFDEYREHKLTEEGASQTRYCIGDVVLCYIHNTLKVRPNETKCVNNIKESTFHTQAYQQYLAQLSSLLAGINDLVRTDRAFETFLQSIEQSYRCYLPFMVFLLKPAHRLLQYQQLLTRLVSYYAPDTAQQQVTPAAADFSDCKVALERTVFLLHSSKDTIKSAVSGQMLQLTKRVRECKLVTIAAKLRKASPN